MDEFLNYFNDTPVISTGVGSFTITTLVVSIIAMVTIVLFLRWGRRKIVERLARSGHQSIGSVNSFLMILNYTMWIVSFWVVIQFSGINLHAFTVIFGALSVGIGFGLQNIVNNVVSGIVILLERPVKLGDRIVVDGLEGNIVDIAIRASTVRTNEGVSIVVPNSYFISSSVINRSLDNDTVRFKIPVNVSYDSNPHEVERILLAVANSHSGVLAIPKAIVIFDEFGDSSLKFYLWVWTREYSSLPAVFRSELNFAISSAFAAAGVRIPYPQLDVHVGSAPDNTSGRFTGI